MIKVLRKEFHGLSILKAFIIHFLLIMIISQHIIFYSKLYQINNDMLGNHNYQDQMNDKSFENREIMEIFSQNFYHSFILDNWNFGRILCNSVKLSTIYQFLAIHSSFI